MKKFDEKEKNDKLIKEAKNVLESLVYNLKDKSEDPKYIRYAKPYEVS